MIIKRYFSTVVGQFVIHRSSVGNSRNVSENLVIAFSAVINALLAAAISFVILTVRRRWLLSELRDVSHYL